MLDGNTFKTTGNQLQIYDYYTPPTGDPSWHINVNGTPGDLIESTNNGAAWPFINDHRYEWTENGVHKFFGWLVKDNNENPAIEASTFFGNGFAFNTGTQTLNIPAKTLSQTGTPQFDFMYSDISPRNLNVESPDFSEVPMYFRHLFTSFKVTSANVSSNQVWLKKVTIKKLKTTKSAQINFSGAETVVTYTDATPADASDFVYTLSEDGSIELIKNDDAKQLSDYTIMWPQTEADLGTVQIVVEYDYKEPGGTRTEGETTIELVSMNPWEAGKKIDLGIMFQDKQISLTCNVEPWTYIDDTIDFTDQISISKAIEWDVKTVQHVDYQKGEVILYSDSTSVAVCNFHIDTPAGSTWTASLIPMEGHVDAFKIMDNTKYGAVGVDSQIKIRVTNQAPIAPRHVVILRITVLTADGRSIIANMMSTGTSTTIKEFKIIQNIING